MNVYSQHTTVCLNITVPTLMDLICVPVKTNVLEMDHLVSKMSAQVFYNFLALNCAVFMVSGLPALIRNVASLTIS